LLLFLALLLFLLSLLPLLLLTALLLLPLLLLLDLALLEVGLAMLPVTFLLLPVAFMALELLARRPVLAALIDLRSLRVRLLHATHFRALRLRVADIRRCLRRRADFALRTVRAIARVDHAAIAPVAIVAGRHVVTLRPGRPRRLARSGNLLADSSRRSACE